MPQAYDGSAKSIEALRLNIARAGVVGSLVANDYRSSADGSGASYHFR